MPINTAERFVLFSIFAGAVVANRLSEIKHWRILLLEAGPDENEISDVSQRKKSAIQTLFKHRSNFWIFLFLTEGSLTRSIFAA